MLAPAHRFALFDGNARLFQGPDAGEFGYFLDQLKGRQTHGAMPWLGIDPIVSAAQIVLGLQTIESRQVDVSRQPSVLSVGIIKGGRPA